MLTLTSLFSPLVHAHSSSITIIPIIITSHSASQGYLSVDRYTHLADEGGALPHGEMPLAWGKRYHARATATELSAMYAKRAMHDNPK